VEAQRGDAKELTEVAIVVAEGAALRQLGADGTATMTLWLNCA